MKPSKHPIFALVAACFCAGSLPGVAAGEDQLAAAIDTIRQDHGIAAAAYFIVSPNSVDALQSLGIASWDTREPLNADHLVRIGSITKTVTALATTVLVERGKLSLPTPVAEILPHPPYQNQWSQKHPMRIAHLLEHTAGLKDLSRKEFAFNAPVRLADAFRVDPDSRRLAWPPGMHSSYSNSGAGSMSGIIEEATGRQFEAVVADEIFQPLGMTSARFAVEHGDGRLISGYDRDGRTPIPYWHTLYRAFGGISISLRDMIPFVQLFLNRGKHAATHLVGAAAVARMQTPTTTLAARAGLGYGYGLARILHECR